MMVTLKSGIIGVHFFCFRTIDNVARLVEKGLDLVPIGRQILKRKLAAKRTGCEGRCIAEMVPEAESGLHLLSELRQGGEIAPHEAHNLSEPPHTVLGL